MRPKTIVIVAANSGKVIPLDWRSPSVSIQAAVTGTIDYTVSYTLQNIYQFTDPATSADWDAITGMTGATASATKLLEGSVNAIKIVVNSGAGSVDITVSQPDSI